jgi:hypothetical protein
MPAFRQPFSPLAASQCKFLCHFSKMAPLLNRPKWCDSFPALAARGVRLFIV